MLHLQTPRPAAGTATGRVWEIADELTRRGRTRARRAEVIQAYVNEGGNANTAHTQFQKWRTAYEAGRKQSSARSAVTRVEIKEGGRILLPVELRTALGIAEGDTLMAEVVDGELRLLPRATAVRRAQEMVRRLIPAGANVVDDFIAERRREAQKEAGE